MLVRDGFAKIEPTTKTSDEKKTAHENTLYIDSLLASYCLLKKMGTIDKLLTIALLAFLAGCEAAYYLPGISPNDFNAGDSVSNYSFVYVVFYFIVLYFFLINLDYVESKQSEFNKEPVAIRLL